jgi:uncharacterized protein YciI
MADYYLVTQENGPAYDYSCGRREQAGWDEHAAFMETLVEEGAIVLGGPIGDGDDDVLLIFDMESEAAIRARLGEDPWAGTVLAIKSVAPWSVWLRRVL